VAASDDNLEDVVTLDNTQYLVHTEAAGKCSEGFYAVPAGKAYHGVMPSSYPTALKCALRNERLVASFQTQV